VTKSWNGSETLESLYDYGGEVFESLDYKIAQGVISMITNILPKCENLRDSSRHGEKRTPAILTALQVIRTHSRLQEIMSTAQINERYLRGRQALFLITESFRTTDNSDIVLGIDHLSKLEYSDSRREEFYYEWCRMLAGIKEKYTIEDDLLRDILYRKLVGSKSLDKVIYHYETMPDSGMRQTYSFLILSLEKSLKRDVEKRNMQMGGDDAEWKEILSPCCRFRRHGHQEGGCRERKELPGKEPGPKRE